jgi:hypothetical protein
VVLEVSSSLIPGRWVCMMPIFAGIHVSSAYGIRVVAGVLATPGQFNGIRAALFRNLLWFLGWGGAGIGSTQGPQENAREINQRPY